MPYHYNLLTLGINAHYKEMTLEIIKKYQPLIKIVLCTIVILSLSNCATLMAAKLIEQAGAKKIYYKNRTGHTVYLKLDRQKVAFDQCAMGIGCAKSRKIKANSDGVFNVIARDKLNQLFHIYLYKLNADKTKSLIMACTSRPLEPGPNYSLTISQNHRGRIRCHLN